jgi:4-amino-4-deoxy-L-arabinose transferase-like glycosyltransferase
LRRRSALALIVVGYLFVGALYALQTPDWQVPDEPAHYNYIRQLAEEGRFPVLERGDYDQDYLSRLTSERFPPELPLEMVEYEDHQPPLYYLLATPVYLAFDGALYALRLFSVLIGAGVVIAAYAVAAAAVPGRPLIALGTAALVAFLPQHVAMMAGVNNDGLVEVLIGVALWMVVGGMTEDETNRERRRLMGLGVVMGLGLVTKMTFLPIALALTVAVWSAWRRDPDRTWRELWHRLALVFGPALLIALPWWLRGISIYGGLDVYGLANHNAVVVGQPRTSEWIADYGWRYLLEEGLTTTFQSFWGQFGWMGVVMPTWLYRALAACSIVLVIGFWYWLREASSERRRPRPQHVVLTITVPLLAAAYVYYNRTFVQHQGRYLFPALIPIALGTALAVEALLRLMRCPDRLRPFAFALPYLALVALDLYALWRFILPALA